MFQKPSPSRRMAGVGLDVQAIQPRLQPSDMPPMELATQIFGDDAPEELTGAYTKELQRHLKAGMDGRNAKLRAIRHTEHAGWLKGKDGWKQRGPDMRKKVRVVESYEQPDKTFCVFGVPIFYPNAVKGEDAGYSAEHLANIIANTNDAMSHGFRPVLVEGHPNVEQKKAGVQLDAQGYPFNFRMDKKTGLVECDLKKVKPAYMARLREQKLPHVSAGFAMDEHNLGKVIGHVAGLGGTAPALRYLPPTEYFSVSGNYLCFSADMETFPKGRIPMLADKHESTFAAMTSAYEACQAAKESKKVNQPDADARMAEADRMYQAACKAHFDAMGEGMPGAPAGDDSPMPPVASGEGDTTGAYEAPGELSGMPAQPMPVTTSVPQFATTQDIRDYFSSTNETDNPALAFNAAMDRIDRLEQVIQAQDIKAKADKNRRRCDTFQAKIVELRRSGRHLPSDKVLTAQRNLCFQAKDPDEALDLMVEGYKAQPAKQTAATFNEGRNVFDARDVGPGNGNRHGATNGKPFTRRDLAVVKPEISEEELFMANLSIDDASEST